MRMRLSTFFFGILIASSFITFSVFFSILIRRPNYGQSWNNFQHMIQSDNAFSNVSITSNDKRNLKILSNESGYEWTSNHSQYNTTPALSGNFTTLPGNPVSVLPEQTTVSAPLVTDMSTNKSSIWTYPYKILVEPLSENETRIELIVLIVSRPESERSRQVIRETWASSFRNDQTKLIFVLGINHLWKKASNTSYFTSINTSIIEEAKKFDDILWFDFQDSYQNLSLKTYLAFRYSVQRYINGVFFLKTDDDTMLFGYNIMNYLSAMNSSRKSFYCFVFRNIGPQRNRNSK